jgi:hypothetical protein
VTRQGPGGLDLLLCFKSNHVETLTRFRHVVSQYAESLADVVPVVVVDLIRGEEPQSKKAASDTATFQMNTEVCSFKTAKSEG